MEMEVIIPSSPVDFNFDSACTTPYISAPSSPQRFGNLFFSAPTSPTRASAFYSEFAAFRGGDTLSSSGVPFDWEEKPGTPKSKENDGEEQDDFVFDFSGQLERASLPADELFDGGKIKPLKPPPRLQYDGKVADSNSPRSPKSPKQIIKEAISPKHRRNDFDPFAAALEQSRKESNQENTRRGRGRNQNHSTRNNTSRSLSPFRVSDLLFEPDQEKSKENPSDSSSSSSFLTNWYRKWKLKDLLLFRSASEGRAISKEQLRKYVQLKKGNEEKEDVKNQSFRSVESVGSSVSSSRRRAAVSAHELHYTVNRAAAEEMRRKTSLPYKHGLLGCLGFTPAVHEISKGVASMSLSRK